MNKIQMDALWEAANKALVNAHRQIELIPEDKLEYRPTPEVRSIGELAVHMHQYLTEFTEAVVSGEHVAVDEPKFATKADLLRWSQEQVRKGNENYHKITDAHLSRTVEAWGEKMKGWELLSFIPTEVLHHRGQLKTY